MAFLKHIHRSVLRQAGVLALALAVAGAGLGLTAARAEPLAAPEGKVLLVVDGKITNTNGPGKASFDDAMLSALPQVEFTTSTPWTDGPVRFSGPTLASVLAAVGAEPADVRAVAFNDYSATVPVDLITDEAPIIAIRRDGKPYGIRDNGPLWIVYPYDADQKYRGEQANSSSVWQLVGLTVAPE